MVFPWASSPGSVALPLPDGQRGASAVGAADVAVASLGHGTAAASHHGS